MAVEWTEHRFSGGCIAFDVANTVVLRGRAGSTFDRFDDRREIVRFAEAATRFRRQELGGGVLIVDEVAGADAMLPMRESIDRLFREAAGGEAGEAGAPGLILSDLLEHCARAVAPARRVVPGTVGAGGIIRLDTAVALSALSMLQPANLSRTRICGNCGWLFIDRSRNSSRQWCDMKVCGNRQKARRHYRRRREDSHA